MKIGDIYYEKNTVVTISRRTGTVLETDVKIVNVLPIDVALKEIRDEIGNIEIAGHIRDVECFNAGISAALNAIDKYTTNLEGIEAQVTEESKIGH